MTCLHKRRIGSANKLLDSCATELVSTWYSIFESRWLSPMCLSCSHVCFCFRHSRKGRFACSCAMTWTRRDFDAALHLSEQSAAIDFRCFASASTELCLLRQNSALHRRECTIAGSSVQAAFPFVRWKILSFHCFWPDDCPTVRSLQTLR